MKIQDFLKHHGIARNPFAEEDAQTDIVFKNHCIDNTFHVGWDKVFGDPNDPSSSIVFGEKGAGKTALKLQILEHIDEHNKANPKQKLFVINYDDFNPFLDRFRDHFGSRFRRADRLLGAWRLWDHMDAILSLGVTQLTDSIVDKDGIPKPTLKGLASHQKRDLLLLQACYDQPKSDSNIDRWKQARSKLGFWTWKANLPFKLGVLGLLLAAVLFACSWLFGTPTGQSVLSMVAPAAETATTTGAEDVVATETVTPTADRSWWRINPPYWVYALIIGLAWIPWLVKAVSRTWLAGSIVRRFRVGKQYTNPLRKVLMNFTSRDILAQPFPNKDRTDDRYELLGKFQNVLESLGYNGILVLMDRLDEPHLINGQAELMQAFLWPILDNKFLKHPGVGIKMMLPLELRRFVDREDRDFYQRARLDKQNMIPSLQWTGSALYDLASSRIAAVATPGGGTAPSLRSLFSQEVTDQRLIESFQSLRTPRHLFKFLYRLLVSHCNAHTDDKPDYEISSHQFESALAVYSKDIEAADAGVGV